MAEIKREGMFEKGIENPYGKFFEGKSYLNDFGSPASGACDVSFEPGCINHWHTHLASEGGGQLLICLSGRGWYQEWGQPARELHAGDVVNIPANVKHWHGAAKDSWFEHISVVIPGKDASTQWQEPVSAEEYGKLK